MPSLTSAMAGAWRMSLPRAVAAVKMMTLFLARDWLARLINSLNAKPSSPRPFSDEQMKPPVSSMYHDRRSRTKRSRYRP